MYGDLDRSISAKEFMIYKKINQIASVSFWDILECHFAAIPALSLP